MVNKVALVTGSDRGLGLEFVKQLCDGGYKVLATAKTPESATELQKLAQGCENICVHNLDQTQESDINQCVDHCRQKGIKIDLAILNAGAAETDHPHVDVSNMKMDELMNLFQVNVAGTARVVQAFLPLIKDSTDKKVVAISTKMASMTQAGKKPYISAPYRITKAAENMLVRLWARDPAAEGVTFVMVHPGHVKTTMGEAGGREAKLEVDEAVKQTMQNVVNDLSHKDNGRFFNYDGAELPF